MSNSSTDAELEDGEWSENKFHIYILSFSYGFLVLVVLVHLVVRWQLRRRGVSHMKMHMPGDKSFKCKAIRDRLKEDFATISKLSPDPALINQNFEPSMYGPIVEGESEPGHWQRMQACEAAAAFGYCRGEVEDIEVRRFDGTDLQNQGDFSAEDYSRHTQTKRPTRAEALPDFISRLQKKGLLCGRKEEEGVASRSCDLYLMARFRDGTFTRDMWVEFQYCLQQMLNQLDAHLGNSGGIGMERSHSLTPDPNISMSSMGHPPVSNRLSLQPLLGSPPNISSTQAQPMSASSAAAALGQAKPHLSQKTSDLSPLILVESQANPEPYDVVMPVTPV